MKSIKGSLRAPAGERTSVYSKKSKPIVEKTAKTSRKAKNGY